MTKREFLDTVFAIAPNEANKIMDAFACGFIIGRAFYISWNHNSRLDNGGVRHGYSSANISHYAPYQLNNYCGGRSGDHYLDYG